MKHFILTTLFFTSLLLPAQETSVFEKLHSTKLDNAVYLLYDGSNFYYQKTLSNNQVSFIKISKNSTKDFQIYNDDNNNLKVYLAFYNPLKYTITCSASEADDSNYTAISTFVSQLPTDMSFIASITDETKAASFNISNFKNIKIQTDENMVKVEEINDLLNELPSTSVLLYDWIYMFKESIDYEKLLDPLYFETFEKKIQTLKGISAVEDYALKQVEITKDRNTLKKTINSWVVYNHENLYNSKNGDLNSFKTTLDDAKDIATKLIEAKNEATSNLEQIKALLEKEFALIEGFLRPDSKFMKDKEFRALNNAKLVMIDALTADKMSNNANSLEQLIKLNTRLDTFVTKFSKPTNPLGYEVLEESEFPWIYEKGKVYDLKAVTISAEGDEVKDSGHSIKLRVFKSQGRLAVFASVGVFYTPFEYKNYGLADGVVTETQGDPVYFRPAAYLNFLLRPKYGDIFYPMFQVGVTQGIKTPLFPLGVGFTIRDKFSITAGPLLAFQNELDKLSLGSEANDATLKDDLESHIRVSWYISLNYKLGK